MSVSENFKAFCSNLVVINQSDISLRYKQITKRLNQDFYSSTSETSHSWYVGSYGRNTAIKDFHDMDVLFQLPSTLYARFDSHTGNGQSALLQEVRNSIKKTYSSTEIGGDGQVVVVRFADKMRFEILPAFYNVSSKYTYPDSNDGGEWRVTDPFPEIATINKTNAACNNNLRQLCRMMRTWRRKWEVPMGGLLLDTLAHSFIKTWEYKDKSFLYYDWMSRDFFLYLSEQNTSQSYWIAPGSGQWVYKKGAFRQKAKDCYDLAVQAISHESNSRPDAARNKWQEIYGTFYP